MIVTLLARASGSASARTSHKVIENLLRQGLRGRRPRCGCDAAGRPEARATTGSSHVRRPAHAAAPTMARSATRWPPGRATSAPARRGCGAARTSRASSTSCSWTRQARSRWPTSLAMGGATESLVLMGDPQQLDQPLQGVAPAGGRSVGPGPPARERPTMPPERGLFLEHTWRMHPALCDFTSEAFYDGRLTSRPHLVNQAWMRGPRPDRPASGRGCCRSEHVGNDNNSPEEAEEVAALASHARRAAARAGSTPRARSARSAGRTS